MGAPQHLPPQCKRRANVVAGTPPDAFSPSGQVWGNPVYDWDALRAEDYAWWMQRFARAFALYDYVRLDHFLGFSSFYAIPRDHNAGDGRWRVGPGRELFERAFKEFGPLPVIAEDLGLITPAIRALMASCGVVGMDVCVFADAFSLDGWQPAATKLPIRARTTRRRCWAGAQADSAVAPMSKQPTMLLSAHLKYVSRAVPMW
mgnify:CR=1 FL=1